MAPDPLAEGARHDSRHGRQHPDPLQACTYTNRLRPCPFPTTPSAAPPLLCHQPCPHDLLKKVAYPMSTSRRGAPMFAVRPGPVPDKEPYWMVSVSEPTPDKHPMETMMVLTLLLHTIMLDPALEPTACMFPPIFCQSLSK
ncbi:hypothetical protein B0H34DRAFT_424843 [Crassisporium funariophilum]|nr:hypothetical protein B0H34DRAFT_424843 [Crassisporium funariophilum]